jgi:hypothetical protein
MLICARAKKVASDPNPMSVQSADLRHTMSS